MGGSAGGLLVGAVLNMRPELFHAAVAKVPFVDTLNTVLDPTLPLTIAEYEEWGNPEHRRVSTTTSSPTRRTTTSRRASIRRCW